MMFRKTLSRDQESQSLQEQVCKRLEFMVADDNPPFSVRQAVGISVIKMEEKVKMMAMLAMRREATSIAIDASLTSFCLWGVWHSAES